MLNGVFVLKHVVRATIVAVVALIGVHSTVLARELTPAEKEIVADAVRDRLRDPHSAMFKWGPIRGETKSYDSSEGSTTYCGYVNSRNAFGGFVGDTPYRVFLVFVDGVVTIAAMIGMGGSQTDTDITYELCNEDGYDIRYFAGLGS